MRTLLLACTVAVMLAAIVRTGAAASTAFPAAPVASRSTQSQEIDHNDDTRVEVQLVVLGIAAGTVFVFGTAVYFLRRRLGLVPPPPEQDAGGHH